MSGAGAGRVSSKLHHIVDELSNFGDAHVNEFVKIAKNGQLFLVDATLLLPDEHYDFGMELAKNKLLRMPFRNTIIEAYNADKVFADDPSDPNGKAPDRIFLWVFERIGFAYNMESDQVLIGEDESQLVIANAGYINGNAALFPGVAHLFIGGQNRRPELSFFRRFGEKGTGLSDNSIRDNTTNLKWVTTSFVSLINSKSTQTTVSEPPEKLNKARARRGKAPMLSVRYVDVPAIESTARGTGGTHASPRLHWRRGHMRRLADRLVPVSPCLVGSAEAGTVQQIYRARKRGGEPVATAASKA